MRGWVGHSVICVGVRLIRGREKNGDKAEVRYWGIRRIWIRLGFLMALLERLVPGGSAISEVVQHYSTVVMYSFVIGRRHFQRSSDLRGVVILNAVDDWFYYKHRIQLLCCDRWARHWRTSQSSKGPNLNLHCYGSEVGGLGWATGDLWRKYVTYG
jgi:hypothetical protein